MKKEIPKTYEPSLVEDKIYKYWERTGYFNPDNLPKANSGKQYSIVMPPPNVTGTLHMGHAATLTIEDILIRYHRMQGYQTLWLPGTDHAAIATQTKVEKILKEEGTDRHKLGRAKFLARVEKYARESQQTIIRQTKKLGASCDWNRLSFTLDDVRTRAVCSVFKMMYDDGLIYRGERVVNWCPRCHSTLADDEVEYKEQKAKLYTFKYSQDFPFAIATTRPETKLGDTAVAVNPKDERYQNYIGKIYEINFVGVPLKLKIIADRNVDPSYGAGALGVTPAHSIIDWQMAEEQNLPISKVINEDGKIHSGFIDYSGQVVLRARQMIVKRLEEQELLLKVEEVDNNLSLCYRCDTPVEPLPSLQWFIDVNKNIPRLGGSLKELAIKAVKEGVLGRKKVKIIPERFEKNYFNWLENLRDWCISRQIWFGHRVPVWYKNKSKVKSQKLKTWNLKIYGEDIFNAIVNGTKTIETRAGRPRGKGKYWGDFQPGDIIEFNLADEETDTIIKSFNPIRKVVKKVSRFNTVNALFKEYRPEQDYPGKSSEEIKQWWQKRLALNERIRKYGIWAIELDDNSTNQEIYVGVEAPKGQEWEQDEDTLDTWFSSGLWTFSTMAQQARQIRIENNKLIIDSDDFRGFHPTKVLETGYDILFFWVARMIIMTIYAVQDIPFQDVYLHGLVLDEKGKKMSKSKGNVVDPLKMKDKYGADATRLSLVIGSTPGNDMRLSEEKISGFRNLVNKLWNISRYIISNFQFPISNEKIEFNNKDLTLADAWILEKMRYLIREVTADLNNYRFSQAGEKLREFTWESLADWYLEISKFEKNQTKNQIFSLLLRDLLKLWHPFIPFVTEVIWSELSGKEMLIISRWPDVNQYNEILDNLYNAPHFVDFELKTDSIIEIIKAIRNARAENKIEPAKKIKAVIYAKDKTVLVESQANLIKNLRTGISDLEIKEAGEKIVGAIYIAMSEIEIYLIGAIDIEKEKVRLMKEKENLEKMIAGLKAKLDNQEFIAKAPGAIVNKDKEKLANCKKELIKLKNQLNELK